MISTKIHAFLKSYSKVITVAFLICVQLCATGVFAESTNLLENPGLKAKSKTVQPAKATPEKQNEAPFGNLLPNNGFETTGQRSEVAKGWVLVTHDKDIKAVVDKSSAFAGSVSASQIHHRGGYPWSYLTPSKPVRITGNKSYRLSAWIKTSVDGKSDWTVIDGTRGQRSQGCNVQLLFKDDAGKILDEIWSKSVATGGRWERVSIDARAPVDATVAEVQLFHGDFKGQSWFDSVRLELFDDSVENCPEWRLYKDVYAAGKLPPTFKTDGSAQAALKGNDTSAEYSVVMSGSPNRKASNGYLVLPNIDNSFPGSFKISGEYRVTAGNGLGVRLEVRGCDVYGHSLSTQKIKLNNPGAKWQSFSFTCDRDLDAEHLSPCIAVEGKDYTVEVRNLEARRLSKMTLEEYAGMATTLRWKALWIWYPEDIIKSAQNADRYFAKQFLVEGAVKKAELRISVDDAYSVYINGKLAGEGSTWKVPGLHDVTGMLVRGQNTIAVKAHNAVSLAGVIAELAITLQDGKAQLVKTDKEFRTSKTAAEGWMMPGFDYAAKGWVTVSTLGGPPDQPWGPLAYPGEEKPADTSAATSSGLKPTVPPEAKFGESKGVPALFINGKETSLDQYWHVLKPYDSAVGNCRKAGLMHILAFRDEVDWSTRPVSLDFATFDAEVRQLLKVDPDGQIFIMADTTGESTNNKYSRYNPSERYVNNLGEENAVYLASENKAYPSFASQKWAQDLNEVIGRLVDHIKTTDYADHVVGYMLSGYEWFQWEWETRGRIDCSTHMRDAFRRWLQLKYKGVGELRKAWGSDTINFSTVEIPSEKERRETVDGIFRDPAKRRNAVDFMAFYSELIAEVLAQQGKTIKSRYDRNILVGTFYGYVQQMFDSDARETSGHFAVKKLLDSGCVDFTMGPSDGYGLERGIGGASGYMAIPGAHTLRNSIYVNEPDFRLHWAKENLERTNSTLDDINIFRREFGMDLTGLAAMQWYDFSTCWQLGDRRITAELAKFSKIEKFAGTLDRTPDNQGIAVIFSEDANQYIGTDNVLFDGALTYHQRFLFPRSGMPHRYYMLSDLSNPRMPDYKFYFFPNAFKLTAEERAMIKSKCMKNGNVVVFVYAPGYVDSNVSVSNMNNFLGINLEKFAGSAEAKVQISPSNQMGWMKDSQGVLYGQGVMPSLFYVNDPSVTVLGNFMGTDKAGLVLKDFGSYKLVYSGAPYLSPDLLRDLGRLAGDNAYLDTNDALYADRNFVAIHSKSSGVKKVTLPSKMDVYDLLNDKVIGRGVQEFDVYLNGYESGLYYTGSADSAQKFFGGK